MRLWLGISLALLPTANLCAAPETEASLAISIIRGCKFVVQRNIGRSDLDAFAAGQCLGVIETLSILGNHLQANMRNCAPAGFDVNQAVKVFIKYAEDHPERLNEGVETLAIDALRTAWPCSKSN